MIVPVSIQCNVQVFVKFRKGNNYGKEAVPWISMYQIVTINLCDFVKIRKGSFVHNRQILMTF